MGIPRAFGARVVQVLVTAVALLAPILIVVATAEGATLAAGPVAAMGSPCAAAVGHRGWGHTRHALPWGAPDWTRTSGLPLRRRSLYPPELRGRAV